MPLRSASTHCLPTPGEIQFGLALTRWVDVVWAGPPRKLRWARESNYRESNYPTIAIFLNLAQPFPRPPFPPLCTMTTSERRAVGGIPPDVGFHSAAAAVLDADMETLIAFKRIVEATPIGTVFESVIVILTLVRVRLPTLLPFSHPLIGNGIRMKSRKICSWS